MALSLRETLGLPENESLTIEGPRIPYQAVFISGNGESENHPYTGAYHMALAKAGATLPIGHGIETFNIMKYSSVLPPVAEIEDCTQGPSKMAETIGSVFGQVAECIEAHVECRKGDSATAGLAYAWVYVDTQQGEKKVGGFVCEYDEVNKSADDARENLTVAIDDLFNRYIRDRRAKGDEQGYRLSEKVIRTETVKPTLEFGAAVVSICFLTYIRRTLAVVAPQ